MRPRRALAALAALACLASAQGCVLATNFVRPLRDEPDAGPTPDAEPTPDAPDDDTTSPAP